MQDSVEKTLGGGRVGTLEQQVGSPGRDWPHVAGRGILHQGDLGKGCSLSHLKLVLASEFFAHEELVALYRLQNPALARTCSWLTHFPLVQNTDFFFFFKISLICEDYP